MMMMARDLFIFIRYSPDSGSISSRVIAADNRFSAHFSRNYFMLLSFPNPQLTIMATTKPKRQQLQDDDDAAAAVASHQAPTVTTTTTTSTTSSASSASHAPNFVTALVAGGMAGTSVDVALFPIDTVKVGRSPRNPVYMTFTCERDRSGVDRRNWLFLCLHVVG